MIFVDSHVHVHACFDLPSALTSAARSFHAAARQANADAYQSVLCMTETANASCFSEMISSCAQRCPLRANGIDWTLEATDEPESLRTSSTEGRLIIIAGSQIVVREGLEVLGLGTTRRFPDGELIDKIIAKVEAAGAIPVIPWGFGKWLGKRGRVVERVLDTQYDQPVLLGDNGNRLRHTRTPPQFVAARRRGLPVLPGSDPLPFPGEDGRIGSYGFVLEGNLDERRPASDLRRRIRAHGDDLPSYGQRERPIRFVRNQIAMQVHKHLAS